MYLLVFAKLKSSCVEQQVEKRVSKGHPSDHGGIMADDDVDHDLLEFMRAYLPSKAQTPTSDSSLGVLESAELICDVTLP